jgi:hypothetical protein
MFEAVCQGLGLAIAVGLIIGVIVPPIMPTWGVIAGAAPLGVIAAGAAFSGADEPLWPALPVGLIGSALAATVTHDVVAGAIRRERGELIATRVQALSGVTVFVVLAAVVLAGLSLVISPISLVALAALGFLGISRRQRAQRKHEGLRVLR